MSKWLLLALGLSFTFARAEEVDLKKLDKCQTSAVDIGKEYLLKDPRLSHFDRDVEFDAPGQSFNANGNLVYCVTAVDHRTHKLISLDVVLESESCKELTRIDSLHPDSACRALEDLNGKAD